MQHNESIIYYRTTDASAATAITNRDDSLTGQFSMSLFFFSFHNICSLIALSFYVFIIYC